MPKQVMGVQLGRQTIRSLGDNEVDLLTKTINSDGFFLWLKVMRELGKPHTPECDPAHAIQINALANKYAEGWNECLDMGENIAQIIGAARSVQSNPPPQEEADFGAQEAFDREYGHMIKKAGGQ